MLKKSGVLCVLAVAALIGLGAGAGLAQDKVYVNGFDAAYPPFSFVDKDGKPAGFDIDALDWIAKEMKFRSSTSPPSGRPSCRACRPRRSTSSPPA